MKSSRWIVVGALVALSAASCASPRDQVKSVISGLQSALETKRPFAFARYISFNYEGAYFPGRSDVIGFIQTVFGSYQTVQVKITDLQITLGEDNASATATFNTLVTLAPGSKSASERYGVAVTLGLLREQEGWRVISGDGKEFGVLPTAPPEDKQAGSPPPEQGASP